MDNTMNGLAQFSIPGGLIKLCVSLCLRVFPEKWGQVVANKIL
jgi:hypothetical protein